MKANISKKIAQIAWAGSLATKLGTPAEGDTLCSDAVSQAAAQSVAETR
jgi:hypothetical protein